ncbi:hypothetical protein CEXT_616731 [Caerostris extrusa]|uniref:Uncharacterized protein n=1 Tax=Caerostris extrusa TaxID=172846 RepID=A0AAV4SYH6_CAEEX|nr:hypothetical protein CEXT_616731 [Caerostris extrusa]
MDRCWIVLGLLYSELEDLLDSVRFAGWIVDLEDLLDYVRSSFEITELGSEYETRRLQFSVESAIGRELEYRVREKQFRKWCGGRRNKWLIALPRSRWSESLA